MPEGIRISTAKFSMFSVRTAQPGSVVGIGGTVTNTCNIEHELYIHKQNVHANLISTTDLQFSSRTNFVCVKSSMRYAFD